MKKKVLSILTAVMLTAVLVSGCGKGGNEKAAGNEAAQTETVTVPESTKQEETEETATEEAYTAAEISVGSLKGPTSMGLVYLMKQNEEKKAANDYTFTMETAVDALLPLVVKGDLDIALVPANVAAILYQKTQGGISVIDVNTLGVLSLVSADETAAKISDLKGKTIYMTGKGTTPDYVLRYLLKANGLSDADVTLEYKSEPAEVAALLSEQPEAYGLLPQPFATAACLQNEALKQVIDLTAEWEQLQEGGSRLVTGVTIVNNQFLKENPKAVEKFMEEHKASADYANSNTAEAAELVAQAGIIEKAAVVAKAMPYCNITYLDGVDMKEALSGYLQVLFEQDPESVGGELPKDEFYFIQ